jgi:CRP/FNR family transcriptional regulator, cyclic AMP receptor protein
MPRPSSSVLDALSPRDREIVLDRLVHRTIEKGHALYFAGESIERAHFIGSGVFKLSARSNEGSETILYLGLPGELLGEVSALDGSPQPLDAIAATRAEVFGIHRELLNEVLHRSPRALAETARLMATRLRWVSASAQERTNAEVPARLASRLLSLAELLGRQNGESIDFDLPLAQADLGSLAGMCRESACKTLRMFKAAGMLDYKGRKVRILRPRALESVRCGTPLKLRGEKSL